MQNNFHLLSIGDASIDVFMTPTESETLCRLDTKECFIAFSYGKKIPVKNLEFSIGGNAANNVVGARRLGLSDAIVITLGEDNIGEMIIQRLKNEGVDTTFIMRQPGTVSNYSTIISYSGERSIFTFHAPRSYEFPVNLPQAPWIYLTSMGQSFTPFYNHVIEWLKKNPGVKLAFNPGTWQLKSGLRGIADVLALTYVIFVNREEAEGLTGVKPSLGREKELLAALAKLGPKIAVITDGGNGSMVFDGQRYLKCPVLPVDAYERTGAGDAFGTGMLSAIIKGRPLDEALVWGTVNSASVIGYVGSQRGLLKETDLPDWLERARSCGVYAVAI